VENIGQVDHFQLGIINDTAPQFTIKEKERFRNKSNTAWPFSEIGVSIMTNGKSHRCPQLQQHTTTTSELLYSLQRNLIL
jgi:hypothetical protein